MTLFLLGLYAALLVGAGVFVSRRRVGVDDFFVAGRRLPSGLVFVSLLAANIGAGSTVGATGLGYSHGLSAWWWSGSAALGCVVLGLFVAPRLHRLAAERGLLTVGDVLEARYDRSVRGLAGLTLWLATLAILAGQLIAMAWALEVLAGVPKAWGCALSGLVVVAYVGAGGLLASAWVNLIELVVLLVGFLVAVPFAVAAAGGWSAVVDPASVGRVAPPGLGFDGSLALLMILAPSFMVSPGLVQKTFGARDADGARQAALWNAAALALFAFVPPLLGMSVRALRPGLANPELALPTLLADLLPPWLGALGLAALFAAEVSTADAVLFMLATSLARDLYQSFLDPTAGTGRLLRVGRLAVLAAGVLGVALALRFPSVVEALKAFYGILTAALLVPLLGGMLSTRPGPAHARLAIVLAVGATLAGPWLLRGSGLPAWLPTAAGLVAATLVFAASALTPRRPAAP